jgi:tetratricopeptide (TPR) repeat protein
VGGRRKADIKEESDNVLKNLSHKFKLGLAVTVIVVCVLGILDAARIGQSRWLTMRLKEPRLLPPAEVAAQLLSETQIAVNTTPNDPEAHSGRALVLLNTQGLAIALPEYERAVALRPNDYFLWLELGRARDMSDDEQGAIAALEQSVRLAPFYAQPRWQLGNVLFRAGRVEESYRELRRAALSDVALLPNLINLVWSATDSDPVAVERIIQPERVSWRIVLAKIFIKRGKIADGLAQFRAAGGISEKDRQELLNELLTAKRYQEAYEVWSFDSGESKSESGIALLNDGGFESKMSRDNSGFGWQLARDTQGLRLSLDRNNPHSGAQSLRVDFNGDSNPSQSILTQLILVEPNTRYRLRFNARTEDIVTGGLPLINMSDVSSKGSSALMMSPPLPQTSDGWHEYSIDFTSSKTTSVILISVHRQNCSSGPCPIFGRMWLDDFVIQKMSNN